MLRRAFLVGLILGGLTWLKAWPQASAQDVRWGSGSSGSTTLVSGTTAITGGTDTAICYDNANKLSCGYTVGAGVATLLGGASSGTGGPAGTTSPSFTTPNLNVWTGQSGNMTLDTATTNAQVTTFTSELTSSGTPAANFGPRWLMQGESSTTVDRDMGSWECYWTTATDASRASDCGISVLNAVGGTSLLETFRVAGYGIEVASAGVGSTATAVVGTFGGVATFGTDNGAPMALKTSGTNRWTLGTTGGMTGDTLTLGGTLPANTQFHAQAAAQATVDVETTATNNVAVFEGRAPTGVVFDVFTTGTAVAGNLLGSARAGQVSLYASGAGLTSLNIGTATSDPVVIATNDTARMTFGATGNATFSTPVLLATLMTTGSAPAVSNTSANSCGTSAASIAGTDHTGIITVGATAGSSCTLAFNVAATTRRECWCSNETTLANVCNTHYTDTTHTNVVGTFVAGDVVNYGCLQY